MNQEGKYRSKEKLSFGVMCNGYTLKKWQLEVIRSLIAHPSVELKLLIINKGQSTKPKLNIKHLTYKVWTKIFFQPPLIQNQDGTNTLKGIDSLKCHTIKKGNSEYFQNEDIKTIESYNLDFVLRFGFGIIRGEILQSAKYGIWSYHHSDEQHIRGGPMGFWEILNGMNTGGVILQKLKNELDSGVILQKGLFKTINHSYSANVNQLLKSSLHFPLKTCNEILSGQAIPENQVKTNAPLYKKPGNFQTLLFIIKLFRNKVGFHFNDLFKAEKWNIGVCDISLAELMNNKNLPEPYWLPTTNVKNDEYMADPFAYTRKGKLKISYEHYSYRQQKAEIREWDQTEKGNNKVIPETCHLAYPYIFEDNGEVYCIPESSSLNEIRLYKYSEELKNFQFESALYSGIKAVDTSICKYNEKYWMFCTEKPNTNSHLYIYFSDNLKGPYKPHLLNPVKCSVFNSRPAGQFFRFNKRLFRPVQNCSQTYGGAIHIMEIKNLSPTEFKEEKFREITPFKESEYGKGLHNISFSKGKIVIDGKKETFIFQNFKNKLLQKLQSV